MREGGERADGDAIEVAEREAQEVLPAPSGHPRFPLMDPLRALAAIAVLLVHVGIFTGGFTSWWMRPFAHFDIGVPIFFLLSGFLLYRPMLAVRVLNAPGRRLIDYGRNRFMRIFPLFWLVLVVSAIVPGTEGAFSANWWVYFGLLDNYPIYEPAGACASNPFDCGVPPAWSLGLEIGFYVTLPLIAAMIAWIVRVLNPERWFEITVGILALAALVSFLIQSRVPVSDLDRWLFYSPLGRAWWFGLGMFLATVSVRAQARGRLGPGMCRLADRPLLLIGAAAFLYLLLTVVLTPAPALNFPTTSTADYLTQYFVFGAIAALLLIPAVFSPSGKPQSLDSPPGRFLGHPVLVWLGLISYGIFLWHFPVMTVLLELGLNDLEPPLAFPVVAILTFLATVVLSLVTFWCVERPIMRWSRARSRRRDPVRVDV